MAYRVQKRISLRRKLHILRTLANSNSVKQSNFSYHFLPLISHDDSNFILFFFSCTEAIAVFSFSFLKAKRTSIAKSTVLYIYKLKVALENVKREYENLLATRREYLNQLNHVQENKV